LASTAGARIRAGLGIQRLGAGGEAQARGSFPTNREAQQLYADGLERLRGFDAVQAQPLLSKAVLAAPDFPLAHMHLSSAWSRLGFDSRALAEAKAANDLSAGLPRAERLEVEAWYHATRGEWPQAIDLYRSLWTFYPDERDYGIALARAQIAGGKSVSAAATMAQLRANRDSAGDGAVNLVAGEAALAKGDKAQATAEFENAVANARRHGARLLEGRARALQAVAFQNAGAAEKAAAAWRQAEAICTAAGDSGCEAEALNAGGEEARLRGDFPAARDLLTRAIALERGNGDRKHLAGSLDSFGQLEAHRGHLEAARAAYSEALAAAREIGSSSLSSLLLTRLGNLDRRSGNVGAARKRYEQSAVDAKESEAPRQQVTALDNQARIMAREGDLAGARRLYEEALAIKRKTASPTSLRLTLSLLLSLTEHQGDLKEARKLNAEYCESAQADGSPGTKRTCQRHTATLLLLDGDSQSALKILLPLADTSGTPGSIAYTYRLIAIARRQLGQLAEAGQAIAKAIDSCRDEVSAVECIEVTIEAARDDNAQGHTEEAARKAEAAIHEAERNQIVAYVLEARLVKAEVARRAKDPSAAQQSEDLARDADRMGFRPIAAAARKLRQ
jgi:tetratricopeptide (TPR) repeat protein